MREVFGDELFSRFVEVFKPDVQKLYASTTRGRRDQDSLLARCYAVGSFVDKPIKIVWAGDEGAKLQGRRLNNAFVDEGDWFYRFVNGEGIRIVDPDPKPIEIELSLSDLVGEE